MKVYHVAVWVGLFLTSCSKPNEVRHPTESYLEEIDSMEYKIDWNTSNNVSKVLSEVPVLKTIEIGSADPDNSSFIPDANIGNIEVDSRGWIYISIPDLNTIKVFNDAGDFIHSIGMEGMGPGEFRRVSRIAINKEKGLLVALDMTEMELFDIKNNEPEHIRTILDIPFLSDDVCITDDFIFTNGAGLEEADSVRKDNELPVLNVSGPIHRYTINNSDEPVDFGRNYRSASGWGVFDGMLSKSKIHCEKSSGILYSSLDLYPRFDAFDMKTGERIWEGALVKIDGFPVRVEKKNAPKDNIILVYEKDFGYAGMMRMMDFVGYQDKVILQFYENKKTMISRSDNVDLYNPDEFLRRETVSIDKETKKMEFVEIPYNLELGPLQYHDEDYTILGPKIVPEKEGILFTVLNHN